MSSSRGAEALVGVWRLEEIRDRTPDGRTGDHPDFGPRPDGFLVYTSSGHVSVQFMARNRPPWPQFREVLEARGLHNIVEIMERAGVR